MIGRGFSRESPTKTPPDHGVGAGRPNILLICTDQQRYDLLGAAGNPAIATPALDRLAAAGVRFDRCYTPSPVCAPARASLLTGRYPHSHGLWANGVALPPRTPLLGRTLADAGYDCGLVGKLHLAACEDGLTERRGDDGFASFVWAHDPTHSSPENAYHRWVADRFPDRRPGDDMPTEAHYSRFVSEEAIAFLTRERTQPYFLMANFFDPHHPFVAPPEYVERFRGRVPTPIPPGPDKPPIQAETSRKSYAGHAAGFLDYTAAEIQEIVANYYAMVALIDDEVARILAVVDPATTLVVFTSDHGEMLGDHAQLLKGPLLYEGAVRVPLVLRWPGVLPAGVVRDELVALHDLHATFLAAAGLPPDPAGQSVDLAPIATGASTGRGWAITEFRNSSHPHEPPVHLTMYREGDHKLIVHHGQSLGELYDLAADPDERANLWDADPLLRGRLTARLLDALVETEDRTAPRDRLW